LYTFQIIIPYKILGEPKHLLNLQTLLKPSGQKLKNIKKIYKRKINIQIK